MNKNLLLIVSMAVLTTQSPVAVSQGSDTHRFAPTQDEPLTRSEKASKRAEESAKKRRAYVDRVNRESAAMSLKILSNRTGTSKAKGLEQKEIKTKSASKKYRYTSNNVIKSNTHYLGRVLPKIPDSNTDLMDWEKRDIPF